MEGDLYARLLTYAACGVHMFLSVCVCVYACVSVSVCSTVAVRRSAIGFHAVVFHKPEKKKYGKNTPYSYCIIAK